MAQYRISKLPPDDQPDDQDAALVVPDVEFKKAQTINGLLCGMDGGILGTVSVKLGKINAKKNTVGVSASATLMDGKKAAAKSATATVGEGGTLFASLKFKAPVGDMTFTMAADGTFALGGDGYEMRAGSVGGNLENGTMLFSLELGSLPDFGPGWVVLDNAIPNFAALKVTGGKKLDAGKAASIKYKKYKDGKTTWYRLEGLDDAAKPNLSGLKVTYTPKTGIFKGSFNIYATNEAVTPEGKQPKLKKFTVNFTGLVVGGRGDGQATMKKPAAGPWAVTIDEKSPSLTG